MKNKNKLTRKYKSEMSRKYKTGLMYGSYESFVRYINELYGFELNLEEIDWRQTVSNFLRGQKILTKPGLMYINWMVATHFGVDPVVVRFRKTRKSEILIPRQVVQFFAVKMYRYRYAELQEFYSIKQHATIINSIQQIENLKDTDKFMKETIRLLTNKLLTYGYDDTRTEERDKEEGDDTERGFGEVQISSEER